jgi:hypothetical protein
VEVKFVDGTRADTFVPQVDSPAPAGLPSGWLRGVVRVAALIVVGVLVVGWRRRLKAIGAGPDAAPDRGDTWPLPGFTPTGRRGEGAKAFVEPWGQSLCAHAIGSMN